MAPKQTRQQQRDEERQETQDVKLAVIASDMKYMRNDVAEIKSRLATGYVTTDEFEPIKKLVYGLVALIMIAVVGAILSLVVTKK